MYLRQPLPARLRAMITCQYLVISPSSAPAFGIPLCVAEGRRPGRLGDLAASESRRARRNGIFFCFCLLCSNRTNGDDQSLHSEAVRRQNGRNGLSSSVRRISPPPPPPIKTKGGSNRCQETQEGWDRFISSCSIFPLDKTSHVLTA